MQNARSLDIAYVVPGLGISGGSNVILEHAARLINRGHRVILLSSAGEVNAADWHPITSVPTYDLSSEWTLRQLANRQLDIVVVTAWQTVYELLRIKLSTREFVYFVLLHSIFV